MKSKAKDRIYKLGRREFDRTTGQEVFRDANNRPYILEEPKTQEMDKHDIGVLHCNFLRRIVQDASGPGIVDATTTIRDQTESREYLLKGYLERDGYYIYDGPKENPHKRVFESKYTTFVHTGEPERSNVTLKDIFEHTEIDYAIVCKNIKAWAQAGWCRDHVFYMRVMEAT
ncbi:MAG: hypothetical protein ACUZ8E_17590 [Candidatus Anammoxibacter sp.]